ncbi:hypothetical protein [Halorubellus litoreus]|uniref:SPW repeat-containing protein n=1 Tax=Halorubellus litoreus TaxID=755308 RepID=A0ABD5VC73_9EURY
MNEGRPDSHRGTPNETPVSAAETLSRRESERRWPVARDLALLAFGGGIYGVELAFVGRVDWPAFAAAAVATAVAAALAWRWPPLHDPGDVRRQVAVLAGTLAGIVAVAYYVLVVDPATVQRASVGVGFVVGIAVARVERAVREPAGTALS